MGREKSPLEGCGWVMISSCPFELVNVEGEFKGRAKLQTHVFHHHVAAQQQESFTINLLRKRERGLFLFVRGRSLSCT